MIKRESEFSDDNPENFMKGFALASLLFIIFYLIGAYINNC